MNIDPNLIIKTKYKNIIKLEKKIRKFDIDKMKLFYSGYINGKQYISYYISNLLLTNQKILWEKASLHWFDIKLIISSLIIEDFNELEIDVDEEIAEEILELAFLCGINDSLCQIGIFTEVTDIELLDNYEVKFYHFDNTYLSIIMEPIFLLNEENKMVYFNQQFITNIKCNKKIIDILGE